MNNTKQRMTIAEAHGWRNVGQGVGPNCDLFLGEKPCRDRDGVINAYRVDERVPDYLNDLNAIHDILVTLTEPQQRNCLNHIAEIVGRRDGYIAPSFAALRASAPEWAEAFLRTLNLWEEDGE